MCKVFAVCGLIGVLAVSSAHASVIRGTIAGWDTPTLSSARVTAVNSDTSVVLETRSALDGSYRFEDIQSGPWLLGASRLSYAYGETLRTVSAADVVQDFRLEPSRSEE